MNSLELTGRARTHVLDIAESQSTLHRSAVDSFLAMRAEALAVESVLGIAIVRARLADIHERYVRNVDAP